MLLGKKTPRKPLAWLQHYADWKCADFATKLEETLILLDKVKKIPTG
jgi:hypothetical protein